MTPGRRRTEAGPADTGKGGLPELTVISLTCGSRPTEAGKAVSVGAPGGPGGSLAQIDRMIRSAAESGDAVLVFDRQFPRPAADLLERLLAGPCHAWHAGLRLGNEGRPELFDFVHPQWMLNARMDPGIEASSWRISLRALLVRSEVIEQCGGPVIDFDTAEGAALEMGLRWIRAGVLVRHVPGLAPESATPDLAPTTADVVRLIARQDGRVWAGWAIGRAVLTRCVPMRQMPHLLAALRRESRKPLVHFNAPELPPGSLDRTVSVVVPTIDRYDYLVPLLDGLANQTVKPHQVLVADQTPADRRRDDLMEVRPELALTVVGLAEPGQSSARNALLGLATGELILLLDDDDEIQEDLIESHLRLLGDGIDAICGAVDDATAGPPPVGFRHRRVSTTFPTSHTVLRRKALDCSGLFDPVFDRGPRADHDLGMRLHLCGALLVYDPSVMVYHHHAPAGGLRTHNARAVTRAGSRRSLTTRNLPSTTELYLGHRYFDARQRREARATRLLSFLSGDGPPSRRVARALTQLALMGATLRSLRVAEAEAGRIHANRPPIPMPHATPLADDAEADRG